MAVGNKICWGISIAVCVALLCVNSEYIKEDVMPKAQRLNLAFYITSLCPDAKRFILNKLTPVFKEFEQFISPEFVLWGKSERRADGSIMCQFGEKDCQGNRLQICALYLLGWNRGRMVQYMDCEMATFAAANLDYSCVRGIGLTEDLVTLCFNSSTANSLLGMAEDQTKMMNLTFVPTIVFNKTYDDHVQEAAYTDFKGFICNLLEKDNAGICN